MTFLTITVTTKAKTKRLRPGDRDPAIPLFLHDSLINARSQAGLLDAERLRLQAVANFFAFAGATLGRYASPATPWWERPSQPDEMTYECDAGLGSPEVVDCAQLQYQLGVKSDSLQIGAGEVRFLSSSEQKQKFGQCRECALLII